MFGRDAGIRTRLRPPASEDSQGHPTNFTNQEHRKQLDSEAFQYGHNVLAIEELTVLDCS